MFSHDVDLLSETIEQDEYGQEIVTLTETFVQANLVEVTRTEFYQAAATDLKPEIAFDVHSFEYSGERLLRFEGCEYSVLRAYRHTKQGLDLTELTCERRVGNG